MKKKFILFVIFGIFLIAGISTGSFAESEYNLYTQYCPKPPYDIASDGKRNFQRITGLNALAAKVAAGQIKKNIRANAKGKFKVKVNSYSLTDAKQGKFKSFEVNGKKIVASDVYISKLNAKTTCKFIHLDTEKNPVKLLEPMAIDFNAEISEDDLNKTLQTPSYKNYTVGVKRRMVKISFFEFSNVISKLKIEKNQIVIENLKFGSTNHKIDGKKMKYLLNIFDPIHYMQKTLKQYNCKTILKSVKIENGNIIISGSAFLGKS